jgi:hypothetical protein
LKERCIKGDKTKHISPKFFFHSWSSEEWWNKGLGFSSSTTSLPLSPSPICVYLSLVFTISLFTLVSIEGGRRIEGEDPNSKLSIQSICSWDLADLSHFRVELLRNWYKRPVFVVSEIIVWSRGRNKSIIKGYYIFLLH